MKNAVQAYFYHTKSERNGTIVLLAICAVLFGIPYLLPILFPRQQEDFSAFQSAILEFEQQTLANPRDEVKVMPTLFAFDPNTASLEDLIQLGLSEKVARTIIKFRGNRKVFHKAEDLQKIYGLKQEDYLRLAPYITIAEEGKKKSQATLVASYQPTLFLFDPNIVTVAQLQQLGLSAKVANTLVNYREKGGTFKQKADLKKIFGLTEKDFVQLEPYIDLPTEAKEADVSDPSTTTTPTAIAPKKTVAKPERKSITIDVNQATPEEWQQLYGIGPYYAKRIVKFREALGGFASIEQIGETYNLPDSTFQSIKSQLSWSPSIKQIKINSATAEELKSHPYLKWKEANIIVKYRAQHGSFTSIDDLKKVKVLSDDLVKKLAPYLSFD